MIFKKLTVNETLYSEENLQELAKSLNKSNAKSTGPMGDMQAQDEGKRKIKRNQKDLVRDAITAMIVCHNVTPVIDDDGNRIF